MNDLQRRKFSLNIWVRSVVLASNALILIACVVVSTSAYAQTSVWRVSDGEHAAYLGGIVPMPSATDYPIPDALTFAYKAADEIYFEVDPKSMLREGASMDIAFEFFAVVKGDVIFMAKRQGVEKSLCFRHEDHGNVELELRVLKDEDLTHKITECFIRADNVIESIEQRLRYNDGRTLEALLSEDVYVSLSDFANQLGVPMADIRNARPGLLTRIFRDVVREKLGVDEQSLETYFRALAIEDRKSMGGLGTAYDRVHDLIYLAEGDEDDFVARLLREPLDMEQETERHKKMISAWLSGKALDRKNIHPIMDDVTVRQRNLRWLPKLEAMFEDDEVEFVLVGMEHIFHDGHGLLELLRERGYTVEQL